MTDRSAMLAVDYFIDLQPETFGEGLQTLFVVGLLFTLVIAGGRDIAGSFVERLKGPLFYLFLFLVGLFVFNARQDGTEGVLLEADATRLTVAPASDQNGTTGSFNGIDPLAPSASGAGSFTHTHDGFTHTHSHG